MFKSWCKEQGFFTKDAKEMQEIRTFLFMDAGKIGVPIEKLKLFCKAYLHFLKLEPIYLLEKLSTNFKFFIDVDLKTSSLQAIPQFIDTLIEKLEQIEIQNNHEKSNLLVYVCNQGKGYHIIYENSCETKESARMRLGNIIDCLNCSDCNKMTFETILDMSVYNTALRCIGSHKMTNGTPEHRYYKPLLYRTDQSATTYYSKIDLQSLSRSLLNLNTKIPKELEQLLCKPINAVSYKARVRCDYSVIEQCPSFSIIEKEIHMMNEGYASAKVKTIKRFGASICITTNHRWCQNRRGEHNSNTIYFVVSKNKQMKQKCFCRCNVKRSSGMCKDYSSEPFNISYRCYKSLISNLGPMSSSI